MAMSNVGWLDLELSSVSTESVGSGHIACFALQLLVSLHSECG